MIGTLPAAKSAINSDPDWRIALHHVLTSLTGVNADALVVLASYHHAAHFEEILRETRRQTQSPLLIGCSGSGIVGIDQELEEEPAISILALSLPGATLSARRLTQEMVDTDPYGVNLAARMGIDPKEVKGLLIFADPFRIDGDGMLAALSAAFPATPIVGGFASPGPEDRQTSVFLESDVYANGASVLAIGGDFQLIPIVSQGCDPIGEAWTVTSVQSHWIETISNRPAISVLEETLNALPEDIRLRAKRNVLVGVAIDEYQHEFLRGDFLICNLVGIDQASGSIAVGTLPRVGQTIQFQMRDAATADLDLSLMLEQARTQLAGRTPVAAVLCTCNGRGAGLFGRPNHDAVAIGRKLHQIPMAGLFCAGEIGPIGKRSFVHGFTASIGVIVPSR